MTSEPDQYQERESRAAADGPQRHQAMSPQAAAAVSAAAGVLAAFLMLCVGAVYIAATFTICNDYEGQAACDARQAAKDANAPPALVVATLIALAVLIPAIGLILGRRRRELLGWPIISAFAAALLAVSLGTEYAWSQTAGALVASPASAYLAAVLLAGLAAWGWSLRSVCNRRARRESCRDR